MAEWFKRGTVNTIYRGSNPLKTLHSTVFCFTLIFSFFSYIFLFSYFYLFIYLFRLKGKRDLLD